MASKSETVLNFRGRKFQNVKPSSILWLGEASTCEALGFQALGHAVYETIISFGVYGFQNLKLSSIWVLRASLCETAVRLRSLGAVELPGATLRGFAASPARGMSFHAHSFSEIFCVIGGKRVALPAQGQSELWGRFGLVLRQLCWHI